MSNSSTLESLLNILSQSDTHKRLQAGNELLTYLRDYEKPLEGSDVGHIVDSLVSWINSSNFKVCLCGLDIYDALVDRTGESFKFHIHTINNALIDRLGDNKDQVREQTQALIQKLMVPVSSPQYLFDKLMPSFTHKGWRVRQEILLCLSDTINNFGSKSLSLSKLVPLICSLLSDPNSEVRDAAISTLVEIYRHVGEKVRIDLSKKSIPANRLNVLFSRFDDIRKSGQMLSVHTVTSVKSQDDTDAAKLSVASDMVGARRTSAPSTAASRKYGAGPPKSTSGSSNQVCGVDDDVFRKCFEDVPIIMIHSSKDLDDHMVKIRETLSSDKIDWELRVSACKRLRSLVVAGALGYENFLTMLKSLENVFCLSAKDLRSQVVREACITMAYLSVKLGNGFGHFGELVLPPLTALIPNSVKIMSTAGITCVKFILEHTHSYRFIPILTGFMISKSVAVRRQCILFIELILRVWGSHSLDRHVTSLEDALKKGIEDADSSVRLTSRKAFWAYHEHFTNNAEQLLKTLEPSKQKMIRGEISQSSSANSLKSTSASSIASSQESIGDRVSHTSTIPKSSSGSSGGGIGVILPRRPAIRTQAQVVSRDRVPNRVDSSNNVAVSSTVCSDATDGGGGRRSSIPTAEQGHRVSQSQPGSRSGSRSDSRSHSPNTPNRMPGTTYSRMEIHRARQRSGIPRSTGHSRDNSPNRCGYRDRALSVDRTLRPGAGPEDDESDLQFLQRSTEAEAAMADALRFPAKRRFDNYAYPYSDDESDISSVCSYGSGLMYLEDITEILEKCASSSWADRKEGLLSLQCVLRSQRMLNHAEIRRTCEIFTRMFADPHGKVFSLFLEVLLDFLAMHRNDISDWLYKLLTRLLQKTGSDLLGSIHAKVNRVLDTVRDAFPCDLQFNILMRYIADSTQTKNIKVRVTLLKYLHNVIAMMDTQDFRNSTESRLSMSRIITWTKEAKSAEIRKLSQTLLTSLFDLNTSEFTAMLQVLPKQSQDGASKLLHNHLRNVNSNTELGGERTGKPSPGGQLGRRNSNPQSPATPGSNQNNILYDFDYEMNSEEVYNSLRQTTAEIQNYTSGAGDDPASVVAAPQTGDPGSKRQQRSTSASEEPVLVDNGGRVGGRTGDRRNVSAYNPAHYQTDNFNGYNKSEMAEAVFDDDDFLLSEADQSELVIDLLRELSDTKSSVDERKNALQQMVRLVRQRAQGMFGEEQNFKTVLLMILDTLDDKENAIRVLALRVLREILKTEPGRFKDYAELTILKILNSHKDQTKEVVRAAEEIASTVAMCLPPLQCIRVLLPIIQTADYPTNLAAIKMVTKVLEMLPREDVEPLLGEVMTSLLKGYEHQESSVRKASVFSLVSIHQKVGLDTMQPYLDRLTASKMKLLNLYIKRAQTQVEASAANGGGSSGVSTPTDLNNGSTSST